MQINKKNCGLDRNSFINKMQIKKIGTGVHYRAIPEHTFYKKNYKWKINDYPNAKKIGRETVSIPISPKINDNELNKIVKAVSDIIKKNA